MILDPIALLLGVSNAAIEAVLSNAVSIDGGHAALSSTAAVSIAGLTAASLQAQPGFPLKAYREGYRQGRVVLGYTAHPDGTVGDIELLDAFPVQVFTRTAAKALAGWRFVPTGASERRTIEFVFIAE